MTQDQLLVLDTPDAIEFASWAALRGALNTEVTTGLQYSRGRSAAQIARERLGLPGRPGKKKVLAILNKKVEDMLAAKQKANKNAS